MIFLQKPFFKKKTNKVLPYQKAFFKSFSAKRIFLILLLLITILSTQIFADSLALRHLSIAELMKIEVIPMITSVSRKSETAANTPAAVFVISEEDIKRSGAKSIPEILRLAPGINVAQIDGGKWAISARGVNSRYSKNLLVLIDGRSIYSPLWGGVLWDIQNIPIFDIERIEIVRGPGGTTWGANAVSGIINILTKNSNQTQGQVLSIGKSSYKSDLTYRYGGELKNGTYRFSVKAIENEPLNLSDGSRSVDDYNNLNLNFRADWESLDSKQMTFEVNMYSGNSSEGILETSRGASNTYYTGESSVSGGHVRFALQQQFESGNSLKLQIYYDKNHRTDYDHEENIDTFDLDFQHSFSPWKQHDIVWGFGHRTITYSVPSDGSYALTPSSDTQNTTSLFVQDTITLKPEKLFWTIGTKIYDHPYVGIEGQPNTRLLWKPSEKHHFWTAFTETRRVPSIDERSINERILIISGPGGKKSEVSEVANINQKSEITKTKEIGYRFMPNRKFSLDLAYFQHDYYRLARTDITEVTTTDSTGIKKTTSTVKMKTDGELSLKGTELSLQWKPTDKFRLVGGYCINSETTKTYEFPLFNPRQWFLRSYWNINKAFQFDMSFNDDVNYYINKDFNSQSTSLTTKTYSRNKILNARFGWRPNSSFELSLTGENLFNNYHKEFPDGNEIRKIQYISSYIPRMFYLKATWFFK